MNRNQRRRQEPKASLESTTTGIKFNEGRALLHLAGMYPTMLEVILELVQNALDKDVQATKIWIGINYQTRHLYVRDNGAGVSIHKFNQALNSVAEPGRKGVGSLGQFGIGLISPLGKCERFTFTSCPAPHKVLFQQWTFETDRIVNTKEGLFIPLRPRPDLSFSTGNAGMTIVKWRSEVSMTKFTDDQFISKVPIDTLIGGIQDRYATVMRRNKVVVSITITDASGKKEDRPNVTAPAFRGRKLPEEEISDETGGNVLFNLYIAPKTAKGRSGRVVMGVEGSDFRFPFHYFARSAVELLPEEVVSALTAGLFEGEIVSQKAELHPSRRTFERNDAYVGLCLAIDTWYNTHGKKHLADAKQSRQEERFQELGLRSMKVLENLFKDPKHVALLDVVKSFSCGTIGSAHAEVPSKKTVGKQDQKALSVDGSHQDSTRNKDGEPRYRDKAETPKEHVPLTVAGPRGANRSVVKSDSFGLQFTHESMEGSNDLWRLDTKNGILRFNIRHPLWILCDEKSDLCLMRLQEFVTIQALTLQTMPENLRSCQRYVLDELMYSFVTWIMKGDRARGTIPPGGRKSSKKKPS